MKRLIALALTVNSVLALSLIFALAGPAHAQSEISNASINASALSTTNMSNAASALGHASGDLVVSAINTTGESAINTTGESAAVVLKGASDGAVVSIQVPARVLTDAGVSIGSAVQVTTEASGYTLTASGKMIAFIPNQVGQSLLGSSRTAER
jgi:hypothetical protein